MTTTTIDLRPFCPRDNGKYHLETPYVRGGFRYACNGHIAVRVPATGEPDTVTPKEFTPPDIDKIFDEATGDDWNPWPIDQPYTLKDGECIVCGGFGSIRRTPCVECEGTGAKICRECGNEKECFFCGGLGSIGGTRCPNCDGKTYGHLPRYKTIGGVTISARYCRMIEALPNVEYSVNKSPGSVAFRFDGGIGVVMKLVVG